jgi:hypothetical protein
MLIIPEFNSTWSLENNEELHSLYSSPNIIRVIKSRRMRWAGHGGRIGEMRNAQKIKPEGNKHSEDIGVDGRIILK